MNSQGAMGVGGMIIWIVILFVIMYFLMIRPQKKEQKRVNAMLSSMEVGDSVVTTSGFYGVIIDLTEEDVIVEFGNNRNCRIPMRKAAIAEVEKALRYRNRNFPNRCKCPNTAKPGESRERQVFGEFTTVFVYQDQDK